MCGNTIKSPSYVDHSKDVFSSNMYKVIDSRGSAVTNARPATHVGDASNAVFNIPVSENTSNKSISEIHTEIKFSDIFGEIDSKKHYDFELQDQLPEIKATTISLLTDDLTDNEISDNIAKLTKRLENYQSDIKNRSWLERRKSYS